MTEQLALPLDALPLAAYDRAAIGADAPLTAGEVAALAYHGYAIAAGPEPGVYVVAGQIDGRDGEMLADTLRSDLDLFYLAARAAQEAPR